MIGAHNGPFRKNRGIAQAGLDFDFRANLYQQIDTDGTDMARTSTFTDLVTVSRTSKKTNAGGWDFTSGSTVGVLTEVNNNEPALDGTKGILIEETSTNEIRNPRFEGATLGVIGSGGVMPTNMSLTMAGAVLEITNIGTENGWPYIEIDVTGTPTTDGFLAFDTSTQIAAVQGETFTLHAGYRLTRGDLTGMDGFRLSAFERSSGGGNLGVSNSPVLSPGSENIERHAFTHTMAQASAAYIDVRTEFEWNSGAVDFRVRIYAPQCEEKEFPTSPILPPASTPGASTRDNDLISLSTSAWTSSGDYSLYVSGALNVKPTGTAVIAGLGDTSNDTTYIFYGASNIATAIRSGGASVASLTPSGQLAPAAGDTFKIAVGVQADNFAFSLSGATQATDTSGALPGAPVRLKLGSSAWSASYGNGYNGYITDMVYFPERLTNAQLESLVGN